MVEIRRLVNWRVLALAAAHCGFLPLPVSAHGIHLHLRVEGDEIRGRADFVGGGPVTEARITVYSPGGRTLGSTKTDDEGRFAYTPREAVDHRFRLDAGAGHAVEETVKTGELPASLLTASDDGSAASNETDLEQKTTDTLSRQIGELREEIARLRRSIRLHDILGGIGYIAGLAGLWFYLKARRVRRE
jgi:nickel transport protein